MGHVMRGRLHDDPPFIEDHSASTTESGGSDFDRALAGVIGGLAAGITKVDRERTDRHASTSAPGWTSQPLVRVSCLG